MARIEAEFRAILGQEGGYPFKWEAWGPSKQTPLWAAREGHPEVVKALLEGESEQGLEARLDMQVRFSGDLEG